jgi:hypothetical protein
LEEGHAVSRRAGAGAVAEAADRLGDDGEEGKQPEHHHETEPVCHFMGKQGKDLPDSELSGVDCQGEEHWYGPSFVADHQRPRG